MGKNVVTITIKRDIYNKLLDLKREVGESASFSDVIERLLNIKYFFDNYIQVLLFHAENTQKILEKILAILEKIIPRANS